MELPSGRTPTVLELCGLYGHSDFLCRAGLDRNTENVRLEFLDQRCPELASSIRSGGFMQLRLLRYLPLKVGKSNRPRSDIR
jgi:hypothetical protein